ncbi:hornerin-like [Iris pallida]|uniref:Hornerin-like n=1 Tax=Iris pallida TaxID=29817 RepID=A0AAX6HYZ7_IRIPA|nr:hornerin-like [Iris pallida]KAJ6845445.1 hornerin-like [Iris pallida]
MGLSSGLGDASSDSLPLLLLLSAVSFLSRLLSLLRLSPNSPQPSDLPSPLPSAVGSRLHSLSLLADHLSSNRPFPYEAPAGSGDDGCIFCLNRLERGDQIRRLDCCHVFHSRCLDGWFDAMNLSCPLCRSPLLPPEDRRTKAEAERRIGAELVAWLSPY